MSSELDSTLNTSFSTTQELNSLVIEKDTSINKDDILIVEGSFKVHRGYLHTFWPDKQGEPRIVIGPHCIYS
jgi:hypothetical protein